MYIKMFSYDKYMDAYEKLKNHGLEGA
ncbi:hypothetical protein CULT_2530001 [[Clostridium] ultunense Esp]|nr:hypothetical protein CULT_2530001 [[Clostridium] ultunense Esp]